MRVYIAGPMRGFEHFNFPAFDEAAARGRSLGHEVTSPSEMDREHGFDGAGKDGTENTLAVVGFDTTSALRRDVDAIIGVDAVALLPGWHKSMGAMAEYRIALWLKRKILDATTFEEGEPNVVCGRFSCTIDNPHHVHAETGQRLNGVCEKCYKGFHGALTHACAMQPAEVETTAFPPLSASAIASGYGWAEVVRTLPIPPSEIRTVKVRTSEPAEEREIKNGDFVLKDSGERTQYSTGAVRDARIGKGAFRLIPYSALERLAKVYEAGAIKYEPDNWRKGIPCSAFADSALRHAHKLAEGWTDEDHAAQAMWNFAGYIETERAALAGELPAELLDMRHHKKNGSK